MGSKASNVILPLVAIGATLATGPAGLGLWGTAAPAAVPAATLGTADKALIGLFGASAVNGIVGNVANAQSQQRALAIQAERQRIQQMSDRLTITRNEAATQKNLRKVLAAQTVAFNARGIDPTTGSPLALQQSTYGNAQDALDRLAAQRELVNADATLDAATLADRRSAIGDELNTSVVDSLLNFGLKTANVVRRT